MFARTGYDDRNQENPASMWSIPHKWPKRRLSPSKRSGAVLPAHQYMLYNLFKYLQIEIGTTPTVA